MPRSDADRLLNVPAAVRIGDRVLTVASLSLRGERGLWNDLAQLVGEEADPFRRAEKLLARLDRDKKAAEKATLLRVLAEEAAAGGPAPLGAVETARRTNPKVLAFELFRRARRFHPELTLEELEAVVTAANVGEVWAELEGALAGEPADGEDENPSPKA